MKKLATLIAFLFCALASFAQFPNNPDASNTQSLFHYKGGITGNLATIITPNDTLNSIATPYFGALTVLPSDAAQDFPPIYMSNGRFWIPIGSGVNRNDTIYTRIPIAVDSTTLPGRRILYLLHLDGVVTPGYVIWTGTGLIFNITPANYYINYKQYNSASTTVTLSAADPSLDRNDLFIVDTTASATFLTGMPGSGVPQTNPSAQLPLTSILIRAGDTIPSNIQLTTLYNENLGNPNEFQTATTGTPTVDFNNTDFPYIGAKAAFVSKYTNGDALTFTHGVNDTVQTGEILRGFISFNIAFLNQVRFQWFNGSTPVSNAIAINSGFGINPNNTGQYQIFAIPLNAWNFPGSKIFNKLVISMSGTDTTGAGGFYLDFLQLQTGLITYSSGREVYSFEKNATRDSIILTLTDGTRFAVKDSVGGGSGGGGLGQVIAQNGLSNLNDSTVELGNTLLHNTTIDVGTDYNLNLIGNGEHQQGIISGILDGDGFLSGATSYVATFQNNLTDLTSTFHANVGLYGEASNSFANIGVKGEANADVAFGYGVLGTTTNGYGVAGQAGLGGVGLVGQTTSGAGARLENNGTSGTGISPVLSLYRQDNVPPIIGFGGSVDYNLETQGLSGIGQRLSNQLISKWLNKTDTAYTSEFSVLGYDSTVARTVFTLSGTGAAKLNRYGDGIFTGTATTCPAFDVDGNIIEVACGGGGGGGSALANFYLKDSSLSSNRTIDLNGKILQTTQGGNTFLYINPTTDAEESTLSAKNTTNPDNNVSQVDLSTTNTYAQFEMNSNFGNDKSTDIFGYADATTSTLTYTADTHTFDGDLLLNSIASGATTDSVLTINPITKKTTWRNPSTFGTTYSGTGYLKLSGTTPSFITTIPIADGGTNNGSLSVTAGTVYYGDGTKLVGLAPGTANQILHSGTTPSWKDTAAVTGQFWGLAGNTGVNLPDTSSRRLGTTNNTSLRFISNNTTRMIIDSSGSVGFGTTNPLYPFTIRTSSNYNLGIRFKSSPAAIQLIGVIDNAGGYRPILVDGTYVSLNSETGGNVGVGVSSPTALLNIKAGTATAQTAPIQLTAGVVETVARSGVLETNPNNDLFYTNAGAARAYVGMWGYVSKSSTYTANANDYTINCTGTFTVTLPTSVGISGRIYIIKNSGVGVITVATTGGETIDGLTTQALPTQYSSLTIQSTGSAYILL